MNLNKFCRKSCDIRVTSSPWLIHTFQGSAGSHQQEHIGLHGNTWKMGNAHEDMNLKHSHTCHYIRWLSSSRFWRWFIFAVSGWKKIAGSQNTKCGWDGYGTGWKIWFVCFGLRYQYDTFALRGWTVNARVIVIHNRWSDGQLWISIHIGPMAGSSNTIQWRNTTNLAALSWYI